MTKLAHHDVDYLISKFDANADRFYHSTVESDKEWSSLTLYGIDEKTSKTKTTLDITLLSISVDIIIRYSQKKYILVSILNYNGNTYEMYKKYSTRCTAKNSLVNFVKRKLMDDIIDNG